MGVRLYVEGSGGIVDEVETETEDDFMYFRDSIHSALEVGEYGNRFPIFMKAWFSDFARDDVAKLGRELQEIQSALRTMPPKPPDGNWRSKLIRSGRSPASLADVYIDKTGAPLIARLIELTQKARQHGLPVRWG
jgi:hypothetical protein